MRRLQGYAMQTVLLICPMELGKEHLVREAHQRFPLAALDEGIGIERVVAFIGSGTYALELTAADGDFQQNFARFLADPDVERFFDALRPFVRDLPRPGAKTAELPLATAMLLWQGGDVCDATTP
ncbi:MAG TPA: hypothetical protein VFI22_02490 [Thermomicrobiales bacterium]|nr:hypothetical protein [Thermomicrobiales bacterium]